MKAFSIFDGLPPETKALYKGEKGWGYIQFLTSQNIEV
jgi:hypothetical protein